VLETWNIDAFSILWTILLFASFMIIITLFLKKYLIQSQSIIRARLLQIIQKMILILNYLEI